jgi:hypothetical protein
VEGCAGEGVGEEELLGVEEIAAVAGEAGEIRERLAAKSI